MIDFAKSPEFVTGGQIRAARVLLELRQADLAELAGLSVEVIGRVERGVFGSERYIGPVIDALTSAGIEFVSDKRANKIGVVFKGGAAKAH